MKTVIAFVLMAACSAYGQFQITEVNVDEVRKNYIEHNGFYIYKVDTRWVFDYKVKNREVKKNFLPRVPKRDILIIGCNQRVVTRTEVFYIGNQRMIRCTSVVVPM